MLSNPLGKSANLDITSMSFIVLLLFHYIVKSKTILFIA